MQNSLYLLCFSPIWRGNKCKIANIYCAFFQFGELNSAKQLLLTVLLQFGELKCAKQLILTVFFTILRTHPPSWASCALARRPLPCALMSAMWLERLWGTSHFLLRLESKMVVGGQMSADCFLKMVVAMPSQIGWARKWSKNGHVLGPAFGCLRTDDKSYWLHDTFIMNCFLW